MFKGQNASQSELLGNLENDTEKFWKKICIVGVSNCQNKLIRMKVVSENGELVNDTKLVLDRWMSDFSGLYERPRDQSPNHIPNYELNRNFDLHDTRTNEYISIL